MGVPSTLADMLQGQPLDFLYRYWGLMIRLESVMQDDAAKLAAHLQAQGETVTRRCDLCLSAVPLETVSSMAHIALVEIERRERDQQTERDD